MSDIRILKKAINGLERAVLKTRDELARVADAVEKQVELSYPRLSDPETHHLCPGCVRFVTELTEEGCCVDCSH